MKKFFNILLVFIIAFFTLPFTGNTVFADGAYDNIENGDYKVKINALEKGTGDESAAANFMDDDAYLSIRDDHITITLKVKKGDMGGMDYDIKDMKIEENELTDKDEDEDAKYFTFQLDSLKNVYDSQIRYVVPSMGMDHSPDFILQLNGLDELPVKSDEEDSEKEEPTEAPEEREVGGLLTEKEADAVYQLEYGTDSDITAGQLVNPVKLLEKDNKEYIQIPINENGAQFLRSLKFDGEEVTWNSIDEGPHNIQFELKNGIEDKLDVSMVIQDGPKSMSHDGIKLWFDEGSLEMIKEPTPEKGESDGDNNSDKTSDETYKGTDVEENSKDVDYVILHENGKEKSTANSFFQKPGKLFEKDGKQYVQVTISNGDMVKNLSTTHGDATIVNENKDGSIDVQFRVNDDLSDTLLKMDISVPGMYKKTHEAIFSFIEGEPEFEDDELEREQSGEQAKPQNPKGEANQEVDKAYKIDYTINHKNGEKKSVADEFFLKPGFLLEKGGKTYAQLTINNADMIEQLSSEYGDAVIIEQNNNGSITVQFRVHNDLSDTLLKMQINVPGVYNEEHEAILVLDKDSKEEVDPSDFKIAKELLDGDKTPKKPKFGDTDNNDGTPASTGEKPQNPKTGDTSGILLYTLLLLGSTLPLVSKVRRRFN